VAQTLEELRVTLTATNEKFDKAFRASDARLKVFEKTMKRQAAQTRKSLGAVTAAATKMKKAFIGLASLAVIKRFASFTKEAFEQTNALQDTADKIGLNVESLQELQHAFSTTGVEAKTVNTGLQRLGRRLSDFATTEAGAAKEAFLALGISAEDVRTKYSTLETVIPKLADEIAGLASDEQKLSVVQKLVDSEGVAMLTTFSQGSAAMARQRQEARDLGRVLEEELTRKAAALNTAFNVAAAALDTQFKRALIELAPFIKRFTQGITGLVSVFSKLIGEVKRVYNETVVRNQLLALKAQKKEIENIEKLIALKKLEIEAAQKLRTAGMRERVGAARGVELDKLKDQLGAAKVGYQEIKDILIELNDALVDDTEALAKHGEALEKTKDTNAASVASLEKGTALLKAETAVLEEAIALGLTARETEFRLTRARLVSAAAVDKLTDAEIAAIDARMEIVRANEQVTRTYDAMVEGQEEATEAVKEGTIDLAKYFDQAVEGIMAGTLRLGDFFKQAGQALALDFGKSFIMGKGKSLDVPLKANALGLVGPNGIVGDILGKGGLLAGTSFGKNFLAGWGVNVKQMMAGAKDIWALAGVGDWSTIFKLNPSQGLGKMFHGLGKAGAGLLGFGLAEGMKGIFGILGSEEAAMGGKVGGMVGGIIGSIWGPVGSFVGAFLGDLIGSVFGSLFAHKPTKGTQIRKGVRDWLKDLGVVFAQELDRKDYFFDETKAMRDRMGLRGGSGFLIASKEVLAQSGVREDLRHQLVALGVAVTKDMAIDLGKNLEQTGVTFANMLIDNLGGDEKKLSAFIADLVSKAGIELGGLVTELNDAMARGAIGTELYHEALQGALSLFLVDLPAGIDAFGIAMDSMTEQGILDLEVFGDKLAEVIEKFKNLPPLLVQIRQLMITLRQQMVESEMAFLARLVTMGVAGQGDMINAQMQPIRGGLASFYERFNLQFNPTHRRPETVAQMPSRLGSLSPDRMRELGHEPVSVAEMMAAIDDLGRLQDLLVEQFQMHAEQIRAEYALKRENQQRVINNLRDERSETEKLYQVQIEGLRERLAIAKAYEQQADALQSTLTQLMTGGTSPLSGQEQLSFLQSRAATLRAQITGASDAERPALMGELSTVLQGMLGLGVFQRPSPEHAALFNDVVAEIEALQQSARDEADKAIAIEQQILDTELAMQVALSSIDQQIHHQQLALERLSGQEQQAINSARAATVAAISDLRDQQIELGRVAGLKLKDAETAIVEELEALGLPTDLDTATIAVLDRLDGTLDTLDTTLNTLLSPASNNNGSQSDGVTFDMTGMQISATTTGNAQQDGERLGRGFAAAVVHEYRTGELGRVVRQDMERH